MTDGLDELRARFKNTIEWYASTGASVVQARTLDLLSKLRPHQATGYKKRRFGSINDGGYVMIDDFEGVDRAFSFGVEQNADWDLEVVQRGLTVYQFDHSIEKSPVNHPSISWEKKKITGRGGPGEETVGHLLSLHDRGDREPNLILKMDIEGSEWDVINEMHDEHIARFKQITCEMHSFDYLGEQWYFDKVSKAIGKLNKHYRVTHLHGNNHCGFANIAGVMVPMVMEISFANRHCYELKVSDESFPTSLDNPCDPFRPDLYLGRFDYQSLNRD